MSQEIQITDRTLLDDLKSCAKKHGRTPSASELNDFVGCKRDELYRGRFGSLSAACLKVGLEPHNGDGAKPTYSESDFTTAYKRIRRQTGDSPTSTAWDRLRNPSEPSSRTATGRYGGIWSRFVIAMEELVPPRKKFA